MIGDIILAIEKGGTRARKHIIVACDYCGEEFPKTPRAIRASKSNYCSPKCSSDGSIRQITLNCDYCEKEFQIKKCRLSTISGLHFCSRECRCQAQTRESGILQCGTPRTSNIWDYRGIALASHGSKCEWCNEILLLDAHHIDHDRTNVTPDNLMVLCVYCHALETRGFVGVGIDRKMVILKEDVRSFLLDKYDHSVMSTSAVAEKREISTTKKRPDKESLSQMVMTMTLVQIGQHFNVAHQTVSNWCRKYDLTPKGRYK